MRGYTSLGAAATGLTDWADRSGKPRRLVTCPWHGSKFCVRDGAIVAGPAAYPQPAFRVRLVNGRVRVLAEGPR